ncbi:MAG: TonB-dependent receptor [Candidatus Aminicenantes bacterium]|nr:TonB-dependent receptor [Candidatus Aminicenantes bacterium]
MKEQKIFLVVLLCLALVSSLNAQATTREASTIRGVVTDNEGVPLPGVTVTVTGPALMGSRSGVTNDQGAFRIPLLPVGTYTLTAELTGFQTLRRENIEVRLATTVTLNFELNPATIEEEVTVTAASPLVDIKASSVAKYFTFDLLQNLPIGRDLGTIVTMAPGVVAANQIKGGTASNTTYHVDGLYANDPDNAQLGVNIDFNIMEEVEVATGGMPAEVAIASGGFINAVTRSGGNDFSGLFQVIYDNEDFSTVVVPEDQLTSMGLGKPNVNIFNYDLSGGFGGPIIKDKLWFYVNGRYGKDERRSGFVPWTSPLGMSYDEYNQETWNWGGFGKFTFQLSKKLRFAVNGNARENFRNTRASGLFTPFDCHYHDDPWGNYSAFGVATWLIDENTFLEARGGWLEVSAMLTIVNTEEKSNTEINYDNYTGYYFGTGYRINEWIGRPSTQASLHLTRFQDNLLGGDHEFKAGLELNTVACNWSNWKSNPLGIDWYDGSPYYWRGVYDLDEPHPDYGDGSIWLFVAGQSRETGMAKSAGIRYSLYAQDSWTIGNRLTINIGFRYDSTKGWIPDLYKDRSGGIAYSVGEATLKTQYGMNPFDEIRQEGVDPFVKWALITPRLGVTYDLFGDGKTALKLHIGRYSDWLYASFIVSYNPLRLSSYSFNWWDDNGNGYPDDAGVDHYELSWGRSPLVMQREYWSRLADKDLKATYDDQISIGIDHELFPDFKVGVSYLYKKRNNIIDDALIDFDTGELWYSPDSGYWVPFTTTVPAIDQFEAATVNMYFLKKGAPEMLEILTNIPEAYRKYSGVDITFDKRFAKGWQLGGSVTISKTWGNIAGGYGNIWGYEGAGSSANWFVNQEGRQSDDRPLVIKLYGTFNLPYGILTSFYYQYYLGTPWQRAVSVYAPGDWADANNIDRVRAPYYYVNVETLGSRRYYARSNLDFRLEKSFGLGRYGKFGVYLDVFNLLGNSYVNVSQNPGGQWRPVDNNSAEGSYRASGSYKRITSITQLSRTFQLSLRYTF